VIGIVNYGLGNVLAISNIYNRLGIPSRVVNEVNEFRGLKGLVLPGVGAFDWAMAALNKSGLRDELSRLVVDEGLPVIGICVGMQMLAASSDEGDEPGLGWIDGTVRSLRHRSGSVGAVCPHMGWNDIRVIGDHALFDGMPNDARFYFLHSYFFDATNRESVMADADYFGHFPCSVYSGNVFGVQFHPEKSHSWGVQLLKNFSVVAGC